MLLEYDVIKLGHFVTLVRFLFKYLFYCILLLEPSPGLIKLSVILFYESTFGYALPNHADGAKAFRMDLEFVMAAQLHNGE